MSVELWRALAARGGVELSDAQVAQLGRYLDLLVEWNARLNLTRIVDRADAEVRHVADALSLLEHVPRDAKMLADVGTGGGVPGVPLAIARPELKVTLVDSTKKKLDAVAAMCGELGLANVSVHHGRAETMRRTFDVVTARAVAALPELVAWCDGLLGPRSVLLAMKGPRVREELDALPRRLRARFVFDVREVSALVGHVVVRVHKRP